MKAYTKQQPNNWTRKFESVQLPDTALFAKLAAGHMIAIEAKYRNQCLCTMYNRARLASLREDDRVEAFMRGIAFAVLVVFLDDTSSDEDSAAVFRLGDLVKLNKDRLEHLGVTVDSQIHSTRLKKQAYCRIS